MRSARRYLPPLLFLSLVAPIAADESIVWDFDTAAEYPWKQHGQIQLKQPGPRPPEFPDFATNNVAMGFSATAYLSVPDPGKQSPFDFTNGDSVTLEAWVNLQQVHNGQWQYIVGKGRTGRPGFEQDNQNWALRITGVEGEARLNFLFATERTGNDAHWHRWTSRQGFPPATGWHHVALTYTFGKPQSIQGWVNGKPTDGVWDLGGPTTKPPIVDDDEIWIGNRLAGSLDQIAIHRTTISKEVLASRFRRIGKPRLAPQPSRIMPEITGVPTGKILFTVSEGLPSFRRWPYESEAWPKESQRWHGDTFLLPRLPTHFDDWGIRAGWNAPVLLRMAADVKLPSQTGKLLLRCRGLGRLWIDGNLVAETKPPVISAPDGEEPVRPLPKPLFPGARLPSYRQQEVIVDYPPKAVADGSAVRTSQNDTPATPRDSSSPTGQPQLSRVVLEVIVGGKGQRTEPGEVCVAMQTGNQVFQLLGDGGVDLTEQLTHRKAQAIQSTLLQLDDATRRQLAAGQNTFWEHRHQLAAAWGKTHAAPQPPDVSDPNITHPIDRFLIAQINRKQKQQSAQSTASSRAFHQQVLPILQKHCFRCHGDQARGGLQLSSRSRMLAGGESEQPAVVPEHPEKSPLILRIRESDAELRMPPNGQKLSPAEIAALETWIRDGAQWPDVLVDPQSLAVAPVIDDAAFLRRVYLDTVGIPPSEKTAKAFLNNSQPAKRKQLVAQLLDDKRHADHAMSVWLDRLAENPTLINPSLNSTGPFRWFLYDSLRDRKPMDRLVTELILLRGGAAEGGSAGFGLAAENDAPMAAKGHILAGAFLGIELQCARCHDSPYHQTTQRDLYSLAAMLRRQATKVPPTSRVPAAFFDQQARASLIKVTMQPDEEVPAQWPFAKLTGVPDDSSLNTLLQNPDDSRERLAALITAPQNRRFARVIVNYAWKRLMGEGLVEPPHDWEGRDPSHPELLDWLAHQFVTHGYRIRHVEQLILTSVAYQRQAIGKPASDPKLRFFNAPRRRRMTAEQIVDSMYQATGSSMMVEELTFVHDGRRELGKRQTLGLPYRAWMFANLNNERDRPSLSLPQAQAVTDVLEAFGWTGARQKPVHQRSSEANVLQPGVLANGLLSQALTRASYQSHLAQLALQAESAEQMVDTLFLSTLTRLPTSAERRVFVAALNEEVPFSRRLAPTGAITRPEPLPRLPQVTWFNHGRPQANEIQKEIERRVRQGPPPDPRLVPTWRESYEDVIWSLLNHHEFVWVP